MSILLRFYRLGNNCAFGLHNKSIAMNVTAEIDGQCPLKTMKIDEDCNSGVCEGTSAVKVSTTFEHIVDKSEEDDEEKEGNENVGRPVAEHEQCYIIPHSSDRKRSSCCQENVTGKMPDQENVARKKLKETLEAEYVENSLKACLEAVEKYNKRDGQLKDMDYHLVLAKAKLTIAGADGGKFVLGKGMEQMTEGLKWFKVVNDQVKGLQKQFADMKQRERKQISKGKDEITDNLKHTKQMLEQKLEHQCDRFKEIQREFGLVKAEFEHVAEERNQVWKKELKGLRQVVRKYEAAYSNFSEVFGGKEKTRMDFEVSAIGDSSSMQNLDFDDTQNCSICMEPWAESGEHNICSLACGHFFGRSCITKWIKQLGTRSSKCPQCSRKATLRDMRNHYMQQISLCDVKIQQNKRSP